MADIKRPNYFTSQFLVEKDFNDEQSYHVDMRRRHNRVLHTFGIADGLDVSFFNATQVQIAPGTAVDNAGREIVLTAPLTYTLSTAGSDLDVFITIGYQETFDPADHYTQGGLDKFSRTTEHPLVQDGTAVPPTDGSVIVLSRVHLNTGGAIGSGSAIDPTVRTAGGARIAPQAVGTVQIADASVTLAKFATDAQPLAVRGTNAITVVTDNTAKQITVGETHSARADNPHATTAAQVDTQGGANQIVGQINAGTGIISRVRVETTVVSGLVTFQNLGAGIEMFSNDIDPGFGPGPVAVQLAIEDAPSLNVTLGGDTNYGRAIQLRSETNRTTGRFRVFANRNALSVTGTVTVRWYAFRPQVGSVDSIAVGIVLSPTSATLINNNTQAFTATVANTSNTGVTWSITETNGGSLSATTGASVTYSPPLVSGTYHVVATSIADPTKKATATINVNADVTVSINQGLTANVIRGDPFSLTATVINTSVTTVTWSILQGAAGGSLSATTGNTITYTAPLAAGTYTVVATSTVDTRKTASIQITVPPVTISISPDNSTVTAGSSTIIRATITGTHDNRANWTSQSLAASVSPAQGPTTTWFAPGVGGFFGVSATAVADTNKSDQTNITVPNVKTGTEGGGGGSGGGGGKFAPILEQIATTPPVMNMAARDLEPTGAPTEGEDQGEAFVRPKKRGSQKLPPKPNDE